MRNTKKLAALAITLGMCAIGSCFSYAGEWKQTGADWQYIDDGNVIAKGWKKIGNAWFYLDETTGKMKTGWIHYKNKWYYLNPYSDGTKGMMLTGWHKIQGQWYFLNTVNQEGSALESFQKIDGNWYYFQHDDKQPPKVTVNATTSMVLEFIKSNELISGTNKNIGLNTKINKPNHDNIEKLEQTLAKRATRVTSGGGGSSHHYSRISSTSVEDPNALIDKKHTHYIDLGFSDVVAIKLNNGKKADYIFKVNGVDVSNEVSNVVDEEDIVKWYSTVVKPKTVEVIRKSDNKKDEYNLPGCMNDQAPSPQDEFMVPDYIITSGPVDVFDLYKDTRDSEGKLREYPTKTTFALQKVDEDIDNILPDDYFTEKGKIDDLGNGEVVMKFNIATEGKEWFDGITQLKLLDETNNTLNPNLNFTKKVDHSNIVTHGLTGVIAIPLPQKNIKTTGKFKVNIISSFDTKTMTVPVETIRNTHYNLTIDTSNMNPAIGEEINFNIKGDNGEAFANDLKNPVYSVLLKYPDGHVKALEVGKEYYATLSHLTLYGTDNDDKSKVYIDQAGEYEVTMLAHGYMDISYKFNVRGRGKTKISKANVDSYTSASHSKHKPKKNKSHASHSGGNSGGGSGDSASGTLVSNGHYLFDTDLLVNAIILGDIGLSTPESETVVLRSQTQRAEGSAFEDMQVIYDQVDYLNTYKKFKKEENKILSFSEYVKKATNRSSLPYNYLIVLEDGEVSGLVNATTEVGSVPPEITVSNNIFDEDLVFTVQNNEYLKTLDYIYLDGTNIPLSNNNGEPEYELVGDNKVKIFAHAFKGNSNKSYIGEHEAVFIVHGYKKKVVRFEIKAIDEKFDITLLPNPNKKSDDPATKYYQGQDVSFRVGDDTVTEPKIRGAFVKNIIKVDIKPENGDIKTLLPSSQVGNDSGYSIDDINLTIKAGEIKESGKYTLYISSNGYANKTCTFEIAANKNVDTQQIKPEYKGVKYLPLSSFNTKKQYKFSFDISNDTVNNSSKDGEIQKWLQKATIKINGIEYTSNSTLPDVNTYKLGAADPLQGGSYVCVYILAKGPESDGRGLILGNNNVVIEAEGYDTLTFEFEHSNTKPDAVVDLEKAKDEKIEEINDDNDATKEEKDLAITKVNEKFDEFKQAIKDGQENEATQKAEEGKEDINAIELTKIKKSKAKEELSATKDSTLGSVSDETKKEKINKIYTDAETDIDNAETNDEVDNVVTKAKEDMQKIVSDNEGNDNSSNTTGGTDTTGSTGDGNNTGNDVVSGDDDNHIGHEDGTNVKALAAKAFSNFFGEKYYLVQLSLDSSDTNINDLLKKSDIKLKIDSKTLTKASTGSAINNDTFFVRNYVDEFGSEYDSIFIKNSAISDGTYDVKILNDGAAAGTFKIKIDNGNITLVQD